MYIASEGIAIMLNCLIICSLDFAGMEYNTHLIYDNNAMHHLIKKQSKSLHMHHRFEVTKSTKQQMRDVPHGCLSIGH